MKSCSALSYCLAIGIVISAVGLPNSALADEQCSSTKVNRYSDNRKLFDQDFGLSLGPNDFLSLMSPFSAHMFGDYFRPWRHLASLSKDLGSTIKSDKDRFEINLDVQHFAPDEITVKTAEGYVVIDAKHEEKKDEHGFISRQFSRRYALPEGVEPDMIMSQLSSDGVLTVSAPRKGIESKERVVPITQTGPIRKEPSSSKQDTCESEACVTDG